MTRLTTEGHSHREYILGGYSGEYSGLEVLEERLETEALVKGLREYLTGYWHCIITHTAAAILLRQSTCL